MLARTLVNCIEIAYFVDLVQIFRGKYVFYVYAFVGEQKLDFISFVSRRIERGETVSVVRFA